MNQELANKIRALPVVERRGERLISLADVLGIITEPEPVSAVEITETPVEEQADEPQPNKVARRRAEAGDR